jgi:hypothetical protein
MRFTNISNRKALKSLQKVAGLYGLVVPCEDVQFPGAVVGHFTGGEPLRAVLPKVGGGVDKELSSEEGVGGTYTGYGLQLTYDVPLGQFNGVLCVRVCWHDVVYLAEVNFAQKAFAF